MKSASPRLFDVVIPLFDKRDCIERCLNSVAKQTLRPRKVFIVNDGSTDGSMEIAEEYSLRSDLDFVIHTQPNRGVSAARNAGLDKAATDFVCFLDADDEWESTFLEKMSILINHFPGADLYCGGHTVREGRHTYRPAHGCPEGFRGYVDFFHASVRGSVANSSKVAVRRHALARLGGFPEGVKIGEDLWVWIRLAQDGRVVCDPVPLVIVHREPDAARMARGAEIPYPLVYYGARRNELRGRKALKQYLARIGIFHVAGSALCGDYKSGLRRVKGLCKVSPLYGLLSLLILVTPRAVLQALKGGRPSE